MANRRQQHADEAHIVKQREPTHHLVVFSKVKSLGNRGRVRN
jgi:hypothetical protein